MHRKHTPIPALTDKQLSRFWSRIDRSKGPDSCWPWQGITITGGYGQVSLFKRHYLAHRVAYALTHGEPGPASVLHNCPDGDNPACCNPAHLWTGTIAENNRDRALKGRSDSRIGALNTNASLTEADVLAIRAMGASGRFTQPEIGRAFGISKSNVSAILRRVSWGWLTDPASAGEPSSRSRRTGGS